MESEFLYVSVAKNMKVYLFAVETEHMLSTLRDEQVISGWTNNQKYVLLSTQSSQKTQNII